MPPETPETRALHRATHALLPVGPDRAEIASDVVVELAGETIAAVRRPRRGDPPPEAGLLVPGLANAHLHLELGWAAGRVPGGHGLPRWVGELMRLPRPRPGQSGQTGQTGQTGPARSSA